MRDSKDVILETWLGFRVWGLFLVGFGKFRLFPKNVHPPMSLVISSSNAFLDGRMASRSTSKGAEEFRPNFAHFRTPL